MSHHLVERLQAENEMLHWRVKELETLLHCDWIPPKSWELTGSETKILRLLLAKRLATMNDFVRALYPDDDDREPSPKTVQVLLGRLRKKLAVLGVSIRVRHAQGWELPHREREHLLELARGHR